MKKLVLSRIDLLARFFAEIETGMKKSIRWKKYYQHKMFRKQTSWDHAGSDINLLTLIVSSHLQKFYPGLNIMALLSCATLHDLGETIVEPGDIGDILWSDKQKDNSHQKIEWQIFKRHFRYFTDHSIQFLSFLAPYYLMQYNHKEIVSILVDDKEIEGLVYRGDEMFLEKKVFTVIEKLLYVIDAAREYQRYPKKRLPIYLNVLRKQAPYLIGYGQEIKGFSYFYSNEDHERVVKFLSQHKNLDADIIIKRL